MINAESVKARLKRKAMKDGRTMQDELISYGLERTIYRISVSKYAERFTLKGGILLYALFDGDYARSTKDIDLLAENMTNDAQEIKEIFRTVFSIPYDDALRFDLDSLETRNITEFKEYHGVNLSIAAYLDRTKIIVSIDIGFGDIIYPKRIKMQFPSILGMDAPEIYTYSVYSIIAEKFEAIVSLGLVNGRYKDFYDIYILSLNYCFDGNKMKDAITMTFLHRGTGFHDIAAFSREFWENSERISRWNSFVRKKHMSDIELRDVLTHLSVFLSPVVAAIENSTDFSKQWDNKRISWC